MHTKSAVMQCRPKCSTCSSDLFMMNGFSLPLVSQYKYLGIILDEHLTFLPAAENRLDIASKAFWSIQSSISNIPGDAFKKLFESLVASVLDYGAPLWAHSIPRNTVERLKQHAYRCFLGVGRKHAAAASAGDMCWMPTFRKHQYHWYTRLCYFLKGFPELILKYSVNINNYDVSKHIQEGICLPVTVRVDLAKNITTRSR